MPSGVWCLFQGKRQPIPWLSFATSLPVYALVVATSAFDWGFFILLSCLPLYFKHILHFDITAVS